MQRHKAVPNILVIDYKKGWHGVQAFFLWTINFGHTMRLQIVLALASLTVSSPSMALDHLTEEQNLRLEVALARCDKQFEDIKAAGRELTPLTLQSFLCLRNPLDVLRRRSLVLRAYRQNINDFKRHLLTAETIRAEPDFTKKMSLLRDYLSNCQRFADGILGFVTYAKTGRAPDRATELVYENFLELARKAQ